MILIHAKLSKFKCNERNVTRRLYDLFNIWPYTAIKICQSMLKILLNTKSTFKNGQSDKISPYLVTLTERSMQSLHIPPRYVHLSVGAYIYKSVRTLTSWYLHSLVGTYIYKLVLTFTNWYPHLKVGTYIYKLVPTLKSWYLHLQVGTYIYKLVPTFTSW